MIYIQMIYIYTYILYIDIFSRKMYFCTSPSKSITKCSVWCLFVQLLFLYCILHSIIIITVMTVAFIFIAFMTVRPNLLFRMLFLEAYLVTPWFLFTSFLSILQERERKKEIALKEKTLLINQKTGEREWEREREREKAFVTMSNY